MNFADVATTSKMKSFLPNETLEQQKRDKSRKVMMVSSNIKDFQISDPLKTAHFLSRKCLLGVRKISISFKTSLSKRISVSPGQPINQGMRAKKVCFVLD